MFFIKKWAFFKGFKKKGGGKFVFVIKTFLGFICMNQGYINTI